MLLCLLHIISYDIWFYISHVILHTPYFYHYHKQHHTNLEPMFLDTYDSSTFETVFQGVGIFFPYMVYEIDIYALLCALAILNARGMLRHDKRGIFLIGNHHLLHHETFNYNYGEFWLDALLGTAYPDKNRRLYGYIYY